jgi:hypothetical protein
MPDDPRTSAGSRLLAEEWDNFDAQPWGSMADHVDAIEVEAAAAERARIREAIKAMPGLPFGVPGRNADKTAYRLVYRAAVLALLEPGDA